MTVGDKILNMRKARGWSQEELADRIGVSRQAVSRWESNSAKPDADKIVDICDLFGVSADYLLRNQYAGEGETNSVSERSPAPDRAHAVTAFQILGILMILSVILGYCALGIMSAVHPHLYSKNGTDYRGILGYIMGNHLWWLVAFLAVVLLAGVLLLVGRTPLRRLSATLTQKLENCSLPTRLVLFVIVSAVVLLLAVLPAIWYNGY